MGHCDRETDGRQVGQVGQAGRVTKLRGQGRGFLHQPNPPNPPYQPEETMFDKFREECGVFGIYGHSEAAKLAYLGLYAMQHRGQESAGITASDGVRIRAVREMGYVNDIFDQEALASLPGQLAIGHTRYSTAGESKVNNAQPILIDCAHGEIAVAHNGNIVNANEIKNRLVKEGSIFQTS